MTTEYELTAFFDESEVKGNILLTLEAVSKNKEHKTGLMNINFLQAYLPEGYTIQEDSTTPIDISAADAVQIVYEMNRDWHKLDLKVQQDMAD